MLLPVACIRRLVPIHVVTLHLAAIHSCRGGGNTAACGGRGKVGGLLGVMLMLLLLLLLLLCLQLLLFKQLHVAFDVLVARGRDSWVLSGGCSVLLLAQLAASIWVVHVPVHATVAGAAIVIFPVAVKGVVGAEATVLLWTHGGQHLWGWDALLLICRLRCCSKRHLLVWLCIHSTALLLMCLLICLLLLFMLLVWRLAWLDLLRFQLLEHGARAPKAGASGPHHSTALLSIVLASAVCCRRPVVAGQLHRARLWRPGQRGRVWQLKLLQFVRVLVLVLVVFVRGGSVVA